VKHVDDGRGICARCGELFPCTVRKGADDLVAKTREMAAKGPVTKEDLIRLFMEKLPK
jgi:hypothetical protein